MKELESMMLEEITKDVAIKQTHVRSMVIMAVTIGIVFFCDVLPFNVADSALKLEAAFLRNIPTYISTYTEKKKNALYYFQFYQCTICKQKKHLADK